MDSGGKDILSRCRTTVVSEQEPGMVHYQADMTNAWLGSCYSAVREHKKLSICSTREVQHRL